LGLDTYCFIDYNVVTLEMNEEIIESVAYDKGYDKGYSDAMEKLASDFDLAYNKGYEEALKELKENLKEIIEINDRDEPKV
jgi:hypothetical protein